MPADDRDDGKGGSANDRPVVPTKWAIDRLDLRERRYCFVAAVVAAFFGFLVYLTETSNHHFRLAKNQLTPQSTLVVGLIAAALLVATTFLGRRAPVGFVALFTGAAFGGSSLVLGLPFFALAIWLLYRSYKTQRQAASTLRASGVTMRERSSSRSQAASSGSTVSSRRGGTAPKRPVPPTGNKRYTPKRPPPPAPKPSRRERRSTAATD